MPDVRCIAENLKPVLTAQSGPWWLCDLRSATWLVAEEDFSDHPSDRAEEAGNSRQNDQSEGNPLTQFGVYVVVQPFAQQPANQNRG